MKTYIPSITALIILLAFPTLQGMQAYDEASQSRPGDLRLLDWEPVSQLVVKETTILKPKFSVIDIHNHMGNVENAEHWIAELDKAGVVSVVNLNGFSKDNAYREQLKAYERFGKDRVLTFFVPDFSGIDDPDWGHKEAAKLEKAYREGIRGVKIFKSLGLTIRDKSGELVPVDDPRIDPFWAKAGELGIPVMIHSSDPKAFFTPVDRYNERYDELGAHPDWAFHGDEFPSKGEFL